MILRTNDSDKILSGITQKLSQKKRYQFNSVDSALTAKARCAAQTIRPLAVYEYRFRFLDPGSLVPGRPSARAA